MASTERALTLTSIPSIRVGHDTDLIGATGCTVILCGEGAMGAVAGVAVCGGAPATRETDLLRPGNLVQEVHAIVLTGGSAFGLDAAGGVMRYLEEQRCGFDVGILRIPIVPAAALFDLPVGSAYARPNAEAGYRACLAATSDSVVEGNVGAGTGATVGKLLGLEQAMKGGLGSAGVTLPDGTLVVALLVVNAVGDISDPATGRIIAGTRHPDGSGFLYAPGAAPLQMPPPRFGNTTIGVVATNATLSKEGTNKVAQMAHAGLARTIRPVHTLYDGDTLFALATGRNAAPTSPLQLNLIGSAAADAVALAVLSAIRRADDLFGIPSAQRL